MDGMVQTVMEEYNGHGAPQAAGYRNLTEYFTRVLRERPEWLSQRDTDPVMGRWQADHPEQANDRDAFKRARVILQNTKGKLRNEAAGRARVRKAKPAKPVMKPAAPRPEAREAVKEAGAPEAPKAAACGRQHDLRALEARLDEALVLARDAGHWGLADKVREARNAAVKAQE